MMNSQTPHRPSTDEQSPLYPTYNHPDITFERGEGVYLYDDKGNDYLDFAAGIAVNSLGHSSPRLVNALKDQADKLWHISNLYRIPGQQQAAAKLCDNSFAERVFFTNSGAEAIECAIKTARRYHYNRGEAERINILTFEGAFHGRTLAAIAAGAQPKYLEGFGPKVEGFISLPFGDHDALKAAIDDKTAAILVEPVQGEGGIRPVPHHCLRDMRKLCDDHDILLIYDEVQTGMGRTGRLFAHQWATTEAGSADPDILATAKGLGGGFPVGACLARANVADCMVAGTHATTFGGGPLAMAVVNAVLDAMLEDGFMEHVQEMSTIMRQQLAELVDEYPDLLEEIRGEGLMLGMKAKIPNLDIVAAFREHRLLAVPAGDNVVRFLPPLTVEAEDLREAHHREVKALDELAKTNHSKA